MRIVNLTGHPLVMGAEKTNVRYGSRGRVRLDTRYVEVETVNLQDESGKETGVSVPILELANGETTSLPNPVEGILYVVSGLVAGRIKRPDVVAPARLHKTDGRTEYARALLRYRRATDK